ncbi:MAG: pyridoxamine 5'-phosphate oxidase family protein [Rhodobacteraceae bacterium]|nr:pyridoxamine 5'-phosphate oxidase family protein [Paracoccaceae bacterium]
MIETIEELEALYGTPKAPSLAKVATEITPCYRAHIEASPFVALATVGPEGTDCTPRGDQGQVVFFEDNHTLALPDWRGNDRLDSLRNIVRDGRVSLMFMAPGSMMIVRVNGTAKILADEKMLEKYGKPGKLPRTVMLISIRELYFQCARALMRADLWGGAKAPDLPTAGDILAEMTSGEVEGKEYDKTWPERAAKTLW